MPLHFTSDFTQWEVGYIVIIIQFSRKRRRDCNVNHVTTSCRPIRIAYIRSMLNIGAISLDILHDFDMTKVQGKCSTPRYTTAIQETLLRQYRFLCLLDYSQFSMIHCIGLVTSWGLLVFGVASPLSFHALSSCSRPLATPHLDER